MLVADKRQAGKNFIRQSDQVPPDAIELSPIQIGYADYISTTIEDAAPGLSTVSADGYKTYVAVCE